MYINKWLKYNTYSLSKKIVAVTGSTGGIGKELVNYIASLGADLILIDRNKEKSEAFAKKLLELYPSIRIKNLIVDLADVKGVIKATEELKNERVDVFIHNAGAYKIPRFKTELGFDNIFQINFLSPYYMIKELIPNLSCVNGKVVVVGSIAHRYSKTSENDIDFSEVKAFSKVYGNAKRYIMFSLLKLFESREDVSLSVCHPGITFTNITAHYPKIIFKLIKYPMKIIFMKPKIAALSVLKGVFDETNGFQWIGPKYFDVWGKPYKRRLKIDNCEAERIYFSAEALYEQMKQT